MEVQLRTQKMDDIAEIGPANHLGYEKKQQDERARRDAIPEGECVYFDEAYERGIRLLQLELADLDVNMFPQSITVWSMMGADCLEEDWSYLMNIYQDFRMMWSTELNKRLFLWQERYFLHYQSQILFFDV